MFRAHIVNGKPQFPARFAQFCADNEGAWLTIEKDEPERSLSQLRMYRAWLHQVAEQTGNDEEALHQFLLDRCAPRAVVKIKGGKGEVEVEQIKRTSGGHSLSMDKNEMGEFMQKCAALTGHPLPTEEELRAMGYISNY